MIANTDLVLRAPELSDLDALYKWENNRSLWYLSNTLQPLSRFALEQYILNAQQDIFTAKQLRLMIVVNQHPVGCIDLFDFDPIHLRAGVGILIDAQYQKQGYASQAIDLVKEYAFQTLHLKQMWCSITVDNEASQHLFQQKQFSPCGVRKQWVRSEKGWLDELLYQCINLNVQ